MEGDKMHYQKKTTSVCDEIDSICTRCKEETIHRVVAMMEGTPHLVICTRCWGQHRYRPLAGAKAKRKSGSTRLQAKGRVNAKMVRSSQPKDLLQEWKNHMENAGNFQPESYDQSASYKVGQGLEHPIYGLGFVRKVIGGIKMEVIFQREIKILVMNRAKYAHS
jgi:hypothetical protein